MIDSRRGRRLFVLDTNVLMHDPTSIFRFQEHDIFIPMVVLEELDHGKKGMSEVARNARQTSRFLDQLMGGASKHEIDRGLSLPAPNSGPNIRPLVMPHVVDSDSASRGRFP